MKKPGLDRLHLAGIPGRQDDGGPKLFSEQSTRQNRW
jgi:hypothetical protein